MTLKVRNINNKYNFFMKKVIIPAILIASFSVIIAINISSNADDLFDANVEALASTELTWTTWHCEDNDDKCHAECGRCNTRVDNEGSLKGFHFCIGF